MKNDFEAYSIGKELKLERYSDLKKQTFAYDGLNLNIISLAKYLL